MKQNRYVNPPKKRKRWEEYVLMFLGLSAAVIVLGAAGALVMGMLERLGIL